MVGQRGVISGGGYSPGDGKRGPATAQTQPFPYPAFLCSPLQADWAVETGGADNHVVARVEAHAVRPGQAHEALARPGAAGIAASQALANQIWACTIFGERSGILPGALGLFGAGVGQAGLGPLGYISG